MLQSVIITGASSGIGKEASLRLAKSGYRVFGLARSYDKLRNLAEELPSESFFPIKYDVTNSEKFGEIAKKISDEGPIFGLVNNAGYVEPGAVEDLSMEDLRVQFETNFFGLIGFTKQILPLMAPNRQGRIVNISSIAGLISLPLIGSYCATKHALEAMSDALRMELWKTGIKVININPGVTETNIHNITSSKIAAIGDSRFAKAYRKYLTAAPKGLRTSVVADAIFEAITSPNPKPRYLLGSRKEKIAVRLKPYIPSRIFYSEVAKRLT